jgi:hypothetical protein
MESAGLGVILDSSVAIDAEREHLNVAGFLRRIADAIGGREASLCVITVAELAQGDISGGQAGAAGSRPRVPR